MGNGEGGCWFLWEGRPGGMIEGVVEKIIHEGGQVLHGRVRSGREDGGDFYFFHDLL